MKKNVVKINESTLRKIVAESVKSILSEIDWKTANRAADIQSKWKYNGRRGGWDRYSKFRDYSDDEANLKFFGQKGGVDFIRDNDNYEGVSWVGFDLGYPQVRINDRDKLGAECNIVPTCIDYCHVNPGTLCAIENFTDDGSSYYHGISNEDVRKYFGEESELYQRFMEAVQEYTDLKNYKYRYDGKQGWHLKESSENGNKKLLTEKGIKYNWRKPGEGQYGGTLWGNEENLEKYYAVYGASVYNEFNEEGDGAINPNRAKGYERFNSYTNTYVKILSLFPKYGKEKYNCVVKAIVGFPKTNNGFNSVYADNKKRAANAIVKALEDCGLTSLGTGYGPIKLTPVDPDENMAGGKIISKEIRPRGKEW